MAKSDIEILEMLHPMVQKAIKIKWRDIQELRPVQREAIPVIITGQNCLIISPTAGGKTEAAFLPVISNIYESAAQQSGIHTIYVAPLKALLNDLEVRLADWLRHIEAINLFKWHGDVSVFHKNKQRKNPSAILLTTPESLDVILASRSINHKDYFCNLNSVIIDEAHYFAADSRGAQLVSALERLQVYSTKPIQRIGLSATVGDPENVSAWLIGSCTQCEIIKTRGNPRNVIIEDVLIHKDTENYSDKLKSTLHKYTISGKTIIFGNSKKEVEMTARLLAAINIPAMVHHGSISKLLREESEELMRSGTPNAVISATSTLELGIDIGDLNRVMQQGNLPSVNSYLQRIGRAGRKDGKAHIILLADNFEDFVLNIAMATLGAENYFEPLRPSRRRYDILFQQLLLEILGNYGISEDSFYNKVKTAFPFSKITRSDFTKLLNHWISSEALTHDGRVLLLGPVIEKKFSHKNFMELYSVFDVNEFHTVYYGDEEIGYLESWFASSLNPEDSVFQLAGRKWRVIELNGNLKLIYVKPAVDALPPAWSGGGNYHIEYEVARRFQDILEGCYSITNKISPHALETFQSFYSKSGHQPVSEGKIGIAKIGTELWLDTYAGSMINTVLTFSIKDKFPNIVISQSFYRLELKLRKHSIKEILQTVYEFIISIKTMEYNDWVKFLSRHLVDYHYSRFSDYIPVEFSVHHSAESYYNLDDLKRFASKFNDIYSILKEYENIDFNKHLQLHPKNQLQK